MKKIFRTIGGKIFLFLICLVGICGTVICTCAAIYCYEKGIYTKSQGDYFGEQYSKKILSDWLVKYNNYERYPGYTKTDGVIVYKEETNILYKVYEPGGTGNILKAKTAGVDDYNTEDTVYTYNTWLYCSINAYHSDSNPIWNYGGVSSKWYNFNISVGTDQITKELIIEARVRKGFPVSDEYALGMKNVLLGYRYKYTVLLAGGVALLLTIICFIGLMCVSARRRKDDGIYPGPLNAIPLDILIGVSILIYYVIQDAAGSDLSNGIPAVIFALCLTSTILYLCMSAAARIKQHTLIKGSLTYRLLKVLFSFTVKVFNILKEGLLNIPLFGKITFILICDYLADILIIYIAHEIGSVEASIIILAVKTLLILAFLIFICLKLKLLQKGAEMMAEGKLDYKIDTKDMLLPSIKKHAENLNTISVGMTKAVDERLKSERMKTELITNVSHDIKTPLTSIINYTGLISREECNNEKHREYCDVLTRQSERLKKLLEDLVEASKAATGNLEVTLAPCDASIFITQATGEFEEKLNTAHLNFIVKKPEEPVMIMADGRRMWRIFDNLLNNICKYSLPDSRVYLTLEKDDVYARFIFKNTSANELDVSENELMERFVRGDSSRNTEGNGLGLSIAKSMAELQGGSLKIEIDGDLFKAILSIPIAFA